MTTIDPRMRAGDVFGPMPGAPKDGKCSIS